MQKGDEISDKIPIISLPDEMFTREAFQEMFLGFHIQRTSAQNVSEGPGSINTTLSLFPSTQT